MFNPDKVGTFLSHYGVKGMKWGVTKSRDRSAPSGHLETGPGWTIDKAGGIEISKDAMLSRVVRNTNGLFGGKGVALDSGRPVYAAFKSNDVNGYEHGFGRSKNLFTKEASTVLKLAPRTTLKAPGPKEASEIYFKMLKDQPETLETLRGGLSGMARANLNKALAEPSSTKAYDIYSIALDSANYSDKSRSVNEAYFKAVKKAGYNMLLDPSDAAGGFDAPVMVLDGGKNLRVHAQTIVDRVSQEKVRQAVIADNTAAGKTYLEKLGYL